MKNKDLLGLFLSLLIVPIVGLYLYNGSPIEAELLTGMIAGSSILLAFQFTLLAKLMDDRRDEEGFRTLVWVLIIGFITLLMGTIFMFFDAVGVVPRIVALSTLLFSFEVNFLFVFVFCINFVDIKKKERKKKT
jgi:predicted Na+-dependent transporter